MTAPSLNNLIDFLKITAFLIFITASFNTQAQEGLKQDYIITVQGDTLKGNLKFESDSLLSLTGANSVKKTYTPERIKEAFKDGNYYSVENVMGSSKFLQQIIIGYSSLYRFKENKAEERFYLKLNDSILTVTRNILPGITNVLINECNETSSDSVRTHKFRYSLNGLSDLVSYYNACKGYKDSQDVKYVSKKVTFKPLVYFGTDANQFKYGNKSRYNAGDKFESGLGFVTGVSIKFGKDLGLSFRPGIQFSHKKASVDDLPVPINDYTSVDMNLIVNFIEAPFLFRYTFAGRDFKPFISFGPHIGAAYMCEIERIPYRFKYFEDYDEYSYFEMKYGVSGGAGIYFDKILKGMEVELRLDRSYYENDMDLKYLQSSSLQFLVGFYINK